MGRFLDSPSRVSDSGTKTDVRRPASKRGPYAPRSCLVWGADRVLGVGGGGSRPRPAAASGATAAPWSGSPPTPRL